MPKERHIDIDADINESRIQLFGQIQESIMKVLHDPRPWAALVFAGLIISMFGSVSISRMFPPRMAKMPANEPEVVSISRDNWFLLRKWTVAMPVSGIVSSIALLVLLRTAKSGEKSFENL